MCKMSTDTENLELYVSNFVLVKLVAASKKDVDLKKEIMQTEELQAPPPEHLMPVSLRVLSPKVLHEFWSYFILKGLTKHVKYNLMFF